MPRRRELRGVAFGLLGAFTGRNNDVDGYWALGKLYQHARASNAHQVVADLLRQRIAPQGPEFNDMLREFGKKLFEQLAARKLPIEWLREAAVRVTFSGSKNANAPGDTFTAHVTLVDDLGHGHEAEGTGACWVHDPAKERRSARA